MEPTILFVCTGNTCRSPMALGLTRHIAAERGLDVEVASAGIMRGGSPATPEGVQAMAERGIDISAHISTNVGERLSSSPDLIVALANNHLREMVSQVPELWPKTFTLKDLVRRAEAFGPRSEGSVDDYLAALGRGRSIGALASALPSQDDVEDPIGQPLDAYRKCADELHGLVTKMLDHLFPA